MLLPDTNIVIAFFKGEHIISEKVLSQIDQIALSSLVIAELDYGAKASQRSTENLEKLYNFIELMEVVPFDLECAKTFGTIKSRLRFENIEGLKIEIW